MTTKRGLGTEFMGIPVATGKYIDLKNAGGVTFFIYEDGGATVITLQEAKGSASAQNLAVINDYYASDGVGSVWTHETADANGALDDDYTLTKKDTTPFDCMALFVSANDLSDGGFDSVKLAIDGAGICFALIHDLKAQRAPQNLPTFVTA